MENTLESLSYNYGMKVKSNSLDYDYCYDQNIRKSISLHELLEQHFLLTYQLTDCCISPLYLLPKYQLQLLVLLFQDFNHCLWTIEIVVCRYSAMLQNFFLILMTLKLPPPSVFFTFPTIDFSIIFMNHILILFLCKLYSFTEIPYLLNVLLKFMLYPTHYHILLSDTLIFYNNFLLHQFHSI